MYLNPQDKKLIDKFKQAHKYVPNQETKEWTQNDVFDAHKQRFGGLELKPIFSCETYCRNEFNSCVRGYYENLSKSRIYETVNRYINCTKKYQKHKIDLNTNRAVILD